MTVKKVGLDYFNVDVDIFSDEKMQYITAKFGLVGEAIILRLMARIYRQGYYYQWDEDQCLLMSMNTGGSASAELIQGVVDEATKRNLFNPKMLKTHSILTSKRIQKHYVHSTARRKNVSMMSTFMLIGEHDADIMNENVDIIQQNGDILPHSIAQHSIAQHSIESNKSEREKWFEEIWGRYPRKKGKNRAKIHFMAQVKTKEDWDNINKALDNYLSEIIRLGTDEEHIKHGSTWFNHAWEDDIDYKIPPGVGAPVDYTAKGFDDIIFDCDIAQAKILAAQAAKPSLVPTLVPTPVPKPLAPPEPQYETAGDTA